MTIPLSGIPCSFTMTPATMVLPVGESSTVPVLGNSPKYWRYAQPDRSGIRIKLTRTLIVGRVTLDMLTSVARICTTYTSGSPARKSLGGDAGRPHGPVVGLTTHLPTVIS